MGLNEIAKADMEKITGNTGDFGVDIVFKTADAGTSVNVVGLATKHHLAFDEDGVEVHSKTASVAIAEKQLIDQSFPNIRDTNGDVVLNGSLVDVKDSTGVLKEYKVTRTFPDEALGLLVFILEVYKPVV